MNINENRKNLWSKKDKAGVKSKSRKYCFNRILNFKLRRC